jgi:hypothetical protein
MIYPIDHIGTISEFMNGRIDGSFVILYAMFCAYVTIIIKSRKRK